MRRRLRRIFTTLWPAFFCAAVLELVVFAFVDPRALHDLQGMPLVGPNSAGELTPMTIQSLAFLFFWLAVAAAIATAKWLDAPVRSPSEPLS